MRAFHPHITIARFARASLGASLAAGWHPQQAVAGTSLPVADFVLYESTLGHDGADYRIVERYRLR